MRSARWTGGSSRTISRVAIVATAAAALAALASGLLSAADPPHWIGVRVDINCTLQCHTLHSAPGGQLTAAAGNVNLCQSCHNAGGAASDLPIDNADRALPGVSGTSHGFDVTAVNATYGAELPQTEAMALRVMNGKVVCSTCHNQHAATSATGGRPRISGAKQVTTLGSSGSVTSSGTYSGAAGSWYLVEIFQNGSETTARFGYSKDNGTSWFPSGCSGAAPASCLTASPSPVALDSGVAVAFTGTGGQALKLGERWELSASYPFLRVALDSGDNTAVEKFCRDCHRSWVMDHNAVESYDGNYKSHPVGIALNANGRSYDRATPLDGNGGVQGSGGADANASNDLKLDGGGRLQCLTCHAVHYADSNTLSEDGP